MRQVTYRPACQYKYEYISAHTVFNISSHLFIRINIFSAPHHTVTASQTHICKTHTCSSVNFISSRICRDTYEYTCAHVCMRTHTYTHMHLYTYVHVYTHAYTCILTYIHTCVYACIHTNKCILMANQTYSSRHSHIQI